MPITFPAGRAYLSLTNTRLNAAGEREPDQLYYRWLLKYLTPEQLAALAAGNFPDGDDRYRYLLVEHPHHTDFTGCVLRTWERNFHDDSDFYALVYDPTTDQPFTFQYNTTRCGGGCSARADASEQLRTYLAVKSLPRIIDDLRIECLPLAREVRLGRDVRVVAGRNLPKDIERWYEQNKNPKPGRRRAHDYPPAPRDLIGRVVWLGTPRGYGYNGSGKVSQGVGILADGSEKVLYSYVHNLEVANPDHYLPPADKLLAGAKQKALSEFGVMKRVDEIDWNLSAHSPGV